MKYRYFIELAYQGTNYHGWQIQPDSNSVQAEINRALSIILREPINVVGAGRTDTGVHASFYVAHFDTTKEIDGDKLTFKLNSFLDSSISIFWIYKINDTLHARFTATSRTYHYYVNKVKNPFNYLFTYQHPKPLDVHNMNSACDILFNHKDFTSFSKLHTDTKTNNCVIKEAQWIETENQYIFKISADRFLRNMVRAIVGTMLEVGMVKIDLQEFESIIVAKDRGRAKRSAPPQALFLTDISYPDWARQFKPSNYRRKELKPETGIAM